MNIELYIGAFLVAFSVLMLFMVIFTQRSWIQTQTKSLHDADVLIKDLHDRLMSKSFDQYKMYDQSAKEYIPPEPEEEMDEFAVGKISGEEIIPDA